MTELKEGLINEQTDANRFILPWKNFQAQEGSKSVIN
jgi:hypothetical protein